MSVLDDRDPPLKLVKEPSKGWSAAITGAKEVLPTQAGPRWPYECQVLPNKIKHIKSVPSVPELFYEPTGKEPMPRPLGEEHGTIIWEYLPVSPVNYFSRSVAGPTPNNPADPAATPCDLKTDHIPQVTEILSFKTMKMHSSLQEVYRQQR